MATSAHGFIVLCFLWFLCIHVVLFARIVRGCFTDIGIIFLLWKNFLCCEEKSGCFCGCLLFFYCRFTLYYDFVWIHSCYDLGWISSCVCSINCWFITFNVLFTGEAWWTRPRKGQTEKEEKEEGKETQNRKRKQGRIIKCSHSSCLLRYVDCDLKLYIE